MFSIRDGRGRGRRALLLAGLACGAALASGCQRTVPPSSRSPVNATPLLIDEAMQVRDWDRSTATSAPGQSGQPGSPHYGDLLPLWGEGRYFPLLYSREAIEKAARQRLVLEPGKQLDQPD